ncbi:MAG: hypothetical protein GOVbin2277_48 [Prokaryotic dsDNA virus sp.]|jgi:cytoskeletal protein CcmA (bactofilin family)|nr:MAG: hypothetical protein GOVbin2277_48 [Prokaryotic dsDNA virus sp.]|tara:strand:- start:3192 stop:5327 length:2136 start_codon:yes stop_codon:yes gene_type:complete
MSGGSSTVPNVFDSSVHAKADGSVTVAGDLTVEGTTTSIETVNLKVEDKLIELASGRTGTPSGDAGIIIERGSATNAGLIWDESSDTWVTCTTSATGASTGDLTLTDAALKTAAITASGNISTTGDIILDDGGSLKEAGGTAAFTFDGSGNVTKIGVDTQTSGHFLKWNGSKWLAAEVTGTVAGSVAADDISTGDAAVTIATTAGNITIDAQGNDTDIIFKGTDNNADTTFLTLDGSAAGAASFNSTVTATGFIIGSANINENDLESIDDVTAGTVSASKAVVVDTNKDVTGFRNITLTGELDAASLDVSGDVDIDGTLEADAITVNGAALATSATTDTTNASNIASGTLNASRMAAAQTAITSVVNSSLEIGRDADNRIKFGTDNQIIFEVDGGDNVIFKASGEIEATSLDISGDVDVDGTLEADAITVNGAALAASATTDATNASNIGSGTLAAARMSATQTAINSLKNTSLVVGRDADNLIDFATDNDIKLRVEGADLFSFTGGSALPKMSAIAQSGTNTNGKAISIQGGLGTGTGVPGSVEILSGIPTSSGSNAHTSTPVAIFDTFGVTSNFGGVANLANDTGIGEIVYFGTEDSNDTLAAGRLMYLASDGNWKYADADTEAATNSLIGIALGDAVTAGILLKGFFKLNNYIEGSFAVGAPCYVSEAASEIDFARPTTAGDFVRVVGFGTATTNVIYFNPDNTYIQL